MVETAGWVVAGIVAGRVVLAHSGLALYFMQYCDTVRPSEHARHSAV